MCGWKNRHRMNRKAIHTHIIQYSYTHFRANNEYILLFKLFGGENTQKYLTEEKSNKCKGA